MSPMLTPDILLHSFELAAVPAAFKRHAVTVPSAVHQSVDRSEQASIFRTSGK